MTTRVSEQQFYRELSLSISVSFLLCQIVKGMATSVSKKVLILGHSFVRRLATDLQRECVDQAVETFNLSGLDVRLFGVGGWTVQKL